jgi:hypothetical protein
MREPLQIKFKRNYTEISQPPKMPEKPKESDDETSNAGI